MKIARAIHQWGRRSPAPPAKHQKTIARHTEKYDRRHSRVMTRIQEWRLQAFQRRLGALFPNDLAADGMKQKNFGNSLLYALKLAVEREVLSFRDRQIVWALATHYSDGQAMVTATLIICEADDKSVEELVQGWEFYSTADAPHRVDLPALSTLERLTMESSVDAKAYMGFELPKSDMDENPFEVFRKFYRIYPHFSRVEL